MAAKRGKKRAAPRTSQRRPVRRASARPSGFVGRDASPVLDRYPPKDPALTLRSPAPLPPTAPVAPAPPAAASPVLPGSSPSRTPAADTGGAAPKGLITLDRPFDVDEFSQLLGETTIQVTVPKEDLAEVLRRITDFMGFGIYVYSFDVRPAAEESLRRFRIELRRVDFSPAAHDWVAFEETGRSESPFGPGGRR